MTEQERNQIDALRQAIEELAKEVKAGGKRTMGKPSCLRRVLNLLPRVTVRWKPKQGGLI